MHRTPEQCFWLQGDLFKNSIMKLEIFVAIFAAVILSVTASVFDPSQIDNGVYVRGQFFPTRSERSVAPGAEVPATIYRQCVDHRFANCSDKLWDQRYWQKWDYYKPGGPIFFLFSGEQNAQHEINLYFKYYAQNYSAAMVVLEHRFYGESYPTANDPPTIDDYTNLLTSQQALMDSVRFMAEFKKSHSITRPEVKDAKVVSFGGSYAGNLAAWSRELYPEVFNMAVASSAPIEAIFAFPGYAETVSGVIQEVDPVCYQKIGDAFNCMENLVDNRTCRTSTVNKSGISNAVHECFHWKLDVQTQREKFFYNLQDYWESNHPGTLSPAKCDILDNEMDPDSIKAYGQFRVDSKQTSADCGATRRRSTQTHRDEEFLRFLRSRDGQDATSWLWQTCNEFGFFRVPDPSRHLFGTDTWTTDVDFGRCQKAFPGANFTVENIQARIKKTNEVYKGRNYDGKCVIFVSGLWDPWHSQGFTRQHETSADNTVVPIIQGEHCDDMIVSNKTTVQAAQTQISKLIGQYLANTMC